MKRCQFEVLFILLATMAIGCSGVRSTGSNGTAGALSAAEIAERGKNSFDVPATSYVFYDPAYSPADRDAYGRTREQFQSDIKAAGKQTPFKPFNAPWWDRRNEDGDDIAHDCVRLERLFKILWDENNSGASGGLVRSSPLALHVLSTEIVVWQREVVRYYDYSGNMKKSEKMDEEKFYQTVKSLAPQRPVFSNWSYSSPDERVQKLGFVRGLFGAISNDHAVGYEKLPPSAWNISLYSFSKKAAICRIYAPPMIPAEKVWLDTHESSDLHIWWDTKNRIIYPILNVSGLEVYAYSFK